MTEYGLISETIHATDTYDAPEGAPAEIDVQASNDPEEYGITISVAVPEHLNPRGKRVDGESMMVELTIEQAIQMRDALTASIELLAS